MSVKATDDGRPLSTSDGRRQTGAAARRPHTDDNSTDIQPTDTEIFVTERTVIVATPGYTRIENPERLTTDYGDPLPEATREALRTLWGGR